MTSLVRRPVAAIERWHGGQLLTLWVACTVGPWRMAAWRQARLDERLRVFLDPAATPGPLARAGFWLVVLGLPLLALVVTAVWVRGRRARRLMAPAGDPATRT